MYLRPIKLDELVEWLINNDYEMIEPAELAQRLIDKFDILITSPRAS